jgi:transcriptional regulatory protein LevR
MPASAKKLIKNIKFNNEILSYNMTMKQYQIFYKFIMKLTFCNWLDIDSTIHIKLRIVLCCTVLRIWIQRSRLFDAVILWPFNLDRTV